MHVLDTGRITLCKHTHAYSHTHIHTYIHTCTYIHTYTHSPGWLTDTKGTLSYPYLQYIIVMPRKMITNGSTNHSTQDQEAISYVFVLVLMGLLVVKAHTYLRMYISWKVRMTIVCGGLLNMMWHMGYSAGKEMRIMSSKPLISRMFQNDTKKVTSGQMAEGGRGFHKFLPHSSLSDGVVTNTQYLYQDCLCLQVLKVEPPMYTSNTT